MMAVPSPTRCAFCGRGIEQLKSGGRPRDYCNSTCRSRAQRQRDRERRASRPAQTSWRVISRDLYVRAQQLHGAGPDQLPLATLLEVTERLREDAECLAAVAVDAARHAGWAWAEVSLETGRREASVRAQWGGARVSRLLSARVPLATARLAYGEPKPPAADAESEPQDSAHAAAGGSAHDPATAEGERT